MNYIMYALFYYFMTINQFQPIRNSLFENTNRDRIVAFVNGDDLCVII